MLTDKYIFFLSVFVSTVSHLFLLSLFKINSPVKCFAVPKVTRVSFFHLDVSRLNPYQENNYQKKGDDFKEDFDRILKEKPSQTSFYCSSKKKIQDIPMREGIERIHHKKSNMEYHLHTQRKLIRMCYPSYPIWAKRAGLQVDIVIKFQILKNGQVGELFFEKFSGYPEMDIVAFRALRRWKFESLPKNVNQALQWGSVTLKFRLNR